MNHFLMGLGAGMMGATGYMISNKISPKEPAWPGIVVSGIIGVVCVMIGV